MDIFFEDGVGDKVDAINAVLDSIGSVGINAEEEIDYNIDAADASKLIDRYSKQIQSNRGKGWWFNREEFHKLQPDPVTGYVAVPSNTIACYVKINQGRKLPVTFRGGFLFDTKAVGYDMRSLVWNDGMIHCELVVNLPFDALPSNAMQAITDAACFWMQTNKEGDQLKMQSYMKSAQDSLMSLQSEDASQKRSNMFDNPFARSAMALTGGFNNVG